MNSYDLSFQSMQNLANSWQKAANSNIGTTERIQLYQDTETVTEFLGRGVKEASSEEIRKIDHLCIALIQGFKHSDQLKSNLVTWVAHNTSHAEGKGFSGAYLVIHNLFEALFALKINPADREFIQTIDSKSLEIIDSLKQGIPYEVIELLYLSRSDIHNLVELNKTAKKNRAITLPLIIDKLISEEINLYDLGIRTVKKIIDYFGNRSVKVTTMNFQGFSEIKDDDVDKICKHFTNVHKLIVNSKEITNKSSDYFSKMTQLKSLDLINCQKITNFFFLKQLKGLECLNIYHTQFEDISFLVDLQNLKSLNLSYCRFKNVNLLQRLTGLKSLALSWVFDKTDMSFLEHLKELENLNFSECKQIRDMSIVQHLTKLKHLNLRKCSRIKDRNFLQYLKGLKSLDLTKCAWVTEKHLSYIKEMKELEQLNLSKTNFTDTNFLQHMQELKELTLSNRPNSPYISDTSSVQYLKKLEKLNLSGSYSYPCSRSDMIVDLSHLQGLKSLKELNLFFCGHISNISLLQNLQGLESLKITRYDQLTDISFLSSLQRLKDLSFNACSGIKNILPIQGLYRLEKLDLSTLQQIENISFSCLQGLQKLKELYLEYCKITNINFLKDLHKLEVLNLSHTKITQTDILQGLPRLKILLLDYCDQITDLNFAQELKDLKRLNIGYSHIKYDEIRYLKKIRSLNGCRELYILHP